VRGIGEGTLDMKRFRFRLRQDYLLPLEYARAPRSAPNERPIRRPYAGSPTWRRSTPSTKMELHGSPEFTAAAD
jgi:hypothetical protein